MFEEVSEVREWDLGFDDQLHRRQRDDAYGLGDRHPILIVGDTLATDDGSRRAVGVASDVAPERLGAGERLPTAVSASASSSESSNMRCAVSTIRSVRTDARPISLGGELSR